MGRNNRKMTDRGLIVGNVSAGFILPHQLAKTAPGENVQGLCKNKPENGLFVCRRRSKKQIVRGGGRRKETYGRKQKPFGAELFFKSKADTIYDGRLVIVNVVRFGDEGGGGSADTLRLFRA